MAHKSQFSIIYFSYNKVIKSDIISEFNMDIFFSSITLKLTKDFNYNIFFLLSERNKMNFCEWELTIHICH